MNISVLEEFEYAAIPYSIGFAHTSCLGNRPKAPLPLCILFIGKIYGKIFG
jgi:hypothetical protein